MANLTITVNDEALKRARQRALDEGTSVNALLQQMLEAYAGVNKKHLDAASALIELSKQATSERGAAAWSREALHDRE